MPDDLRWIRTLGLYVAAVGVAQVGLDLSMLWWPEARQMAFYLDPRLGLSAFGEVVGVPPWIVRWASAVLLLWAAWQLTTRPGVRALRIYAALELVLGLPSLIFIAMVLVAGLSAAHVFSLGELVAPLPVYLLASALPLVWAGCLWRRARRTQPSA